MSAEDEGFTDMNPPPENGIINRVDRQSASVIQIDNGKSVQAVAICAALCGLSVAIAVWAAYTARDAATEARLVQYYLMDTHSRSDEEIKRWIEFEKQHSK